MKVRLHNPINRLRDEKSNNVNTFIDTIKEGDTGGTVIAAAQGS